MENPQKKYTIPYKKFAPINPVTLLQRNNEKQNNLNQNVGGSNKTITVPQFYSPFPTTPNDGSYASKQGNITNSLAVSHSKYDHFAFDGGKKSRRSKSRRSKSRRSKSRRSKSKRTKSRKSKSRKSKSKRIQYTRSKLKKSKKSRKFKN